MTKATVAEVAVIGEATAAADGWNFERCLLRRLDLADQSHFGRWDHTW